ncbi:S-layer homology domain-containing protein [Paenibacillus sp. NRS-1760]|uniref:S-layer homology domain-containing protein n=1 Tax=Paenibacillus sp. NRS-1760 TaxID=3233902 RepID=UPI003D29BF60
MTKKAISLWLIICMVCGSFSGSIAAESASKLLWDYEDEFPAGQEVNHGGIIRFVDPAKDTLYVRFDKLTEEPGADQPNPRATSVKLFTEEGKIVRNFKLSMSERETGRTLNAVVYDQYGNPISGSSINYVILKTDVGQGYAASKTNTDNEVTIFPKRPGTVDIEARVNGGIKAAVSIEVTNDEVLDNPEEPSSIYTALVDDKVFAAAAEDANEATFAIRKSELQEGSVIQIRNELEVAVYQVSVSFEEPGSAQRASSVKMLDASGEEITQLQISMSEASEGRTITAVVYDQSNVPMAGAAVNWVILDTDDAPGYAAEKQSVGATSTILPKRIGTVLLEARYNQTIKASVPITIVSELTEPASPLKAEAQAKLAALGELMNIAEELGIDITREEAVIWMSEQFILFADWDEANIELNAKLYEQMALFKGQGNTLANELPDFERQEVIEMLDSAIGQLQDVLDGKLTRKPVPPMDWVQVELNGNFFESNGKPVFIYDYFSKPLNQSTMDPGLYNDYLGNVDHPKALSINFQNADGTIDMERMKDLTERPNTNIGYLNLWHSGIPYNANDPSSGWWGYDDQWESVWGEGIGPEMRIGRNYQYANYDIDNPALRKIWDSIFNNVVPQTAGKPYTTLGYMLFNEPHWYTSSDSWAKIPQGISSYTVGKFRAWLTTKHGSIETLNTLWGTDFASFDEVHIQIPLDASEHGTPKWYDWSRFNMDRVTEWLTFLNDGIMRNDPDAKTHMKIMPNVFTEGNRDHGIDLEALTEMAGMIGDDSKFRKRDLRAGNEPETWEADYSFFWQEMFMAYDFMESVSPEKAHINTELHSLSTTQFRIIDMKPEYVRSTFWLSTLLGMDASLTWFWGRNADGSIEQRLIDAADQPGGLGKSYPASVAQQPRVANELTQTMMDMNAFSEELVGFQNQRKPIRVFYSESSAINNSHYMDELFELYEPMVFEGVPIGFATGNMIEKRDHQEWDVIAVYKTEEVTDKEFAALQSYLDQGGTVIIDNVSLKFDEYRKLRTETLHQSNGKLMTMEDGMAASMLAKALQSLPTSEMPAIELLEDNGGLKKGSFWRVQPNGQDRYIMTIVNMGKNSSNLRLKAADGKKITIKDMMTGGALSSSIVLQPEGVLLLEVQAEAAPPVEQGNTGSGGAAPVQKDTAEFEIMEELMDNAGNQSRNGIASIAVHIPADVKEVIVSLPAEGIKKWAEKNIRRIEVDMGLATASFPISMLMRSIGSSPDHVEMSVQLVDPDKLDVDVAKALQGNPVYDFTLAINGQSVNEFGSDQFVELQWHYASDPLEQPHLIVGYYLNEDGQLEVVPISRYDEQSGKVVIRVHHFSPYSAAGASSVFEDLASAPWAKEEIEALAVRGIVNGVDHRSFKPESSVTRAEFIKLLMEAWELKDVSRSSTFTDAKAGQWYSDSLSTAQNLGIVFGRADGSFGINEPITRQEIATVIGRLALINNVVLPSKENFGAYKDQAEISDYAQDSVELLQQSGIMIGFKDGRFGPGQMATRAEAAVLIYRLYELYTTTI